MICARRLKSFRRRNHDSSIFTRPFSTGSVISRPHVILRRDGRNDVNDPNQSSTRSVFAYGDLWNVSRDHSGLMSANLITLPHFSVSSVTSLPKSAGEPTSTVPPRSASRAFSFGSARPALISLLSLSMISAHRRDVWQPLPACRGRHRQ